MSFRCFAVTFDLVDGRENTTFRDRLLGMHYYTVVVHRNASTPHVLIDGGTTPLIPRGVHVSFLSIHDVPETTFTVERYSDNNQTTPALVGSLHGGELVRGFFKKNSVLLFFQSRNTVHSCVQLKFDSIPQSKFRLRFNNNRSVDAIVPFFDWWRRRQYVCVVYRWQGPENVNCKEEPVCFFLFFFVGMYCKDSCFIIIIIILLVVERISNCFVDQQRKSDRQAAQQYVVDCRLPS